MLLDEEKDLINEIFSKMNVKMYNISFLILKDKFDVEEAVAQTFLKIIDNIGKIAILPYPQIEPYCVTILKNESMNIIRQRKKNVYVDDLDCNDESHNIEEEFLETLTRQELISFINKLSDDEKNFVHLRFVHEMSFKNISELLDITEEAAKKRCQRIIKKLRSYYEGGDTIVQNNY